MSKELTKEEAEEYYNKLWLENKDLIQENIDRLNKKRFAQTLMLAEKQEEIERLNKELKTTANKCKQKENIIKEVREYIDENVFHSKNQEEQELYDIALLEILDKENK